MFRRTRLFTLMAAVLFVGLVSRGAPAFASSTTGLTRLTGHVLPALSQAVPLPAATSSATDPLTLTLTLNRTNQSGFDAFLQSVQDPRSATYQHYLTQQQLADRFGPSQSAYDRVLHWLQGQGFALVEGSQNRLTLTARGTRAQAEQALLVHIHDYQLGKRTFYANDRDPQLPASIAKKVQAIVGLSNLAAPQTDFYHVDQLENTCVTVGVLTAAACAAVIGGLFALARFCIVAVVSFIVAIACLATIAIAFAILIRVEGDRSQHGTPTTASGGGSPATGSPPNAPNAAPADWQGYTGAGQKIGLVEFDSFHPTDVSDWLTFLYTPAAQVDEQMTRLHQVHVNGGVPTPGAGEPEVLLDIDAVFGVAPGADLTVYDAPASTSYQTLFNRMIGDGMTVISNSWSYCESQTNLADVTSIDAILASAAASGVSVFNGSGDTGTTCLGSSPNTIGVPADSPHATAVGGTTLHLGTGISYGSEQWWDGTSQNPSTGQGGFGTSRFFTRPAFQDGHSSAPMRSIPDVAAPADPGSGYLICQRDVGACPGTSIYYGTSLSAPEWASMAAILNQAQGRNLGNLNPLLYPLANGLGFHSAASMGSDFAHVGLGSPSLNALSLALRGMTVGAADAQHAQVSSLAPFDFADGVTPGIINVFLLDANGNGVKGKNISLAANPSGNVHIAPPNGTTGSEAGAIAFVVTDSVAENVTFTATDTTDNLVLAQTATLQFLTPPAAAGGISASPTNVLPDGHASTTITVTLQDSQGNGAPGKSVALSQNGGHSVITGPSPVTTDSNGQVTFQATDTTTESVTYTATDVTDANRPVPGGATVTFSTGPGCNLNVATAAPGYTITTFAGGFPHGANAACSGPVGLAFDNSGNLLVIDSQDSGLYKFGPGGGVASAATRIAALQIGFNEPPGGLAFSKDGQHLYLGVGIGDAFFGYLEEIDPSTGAFLRQVAGLNSPLGLATDPISGDLFVASGSFFDNTKIYRITNPATSPMLSVYSSPGGTDGIAFGPDGSLYGASYDGHTNQVTRITATNATPPGVFSYLAPLDHATGPDGVAVGANPANPGQPPFVLVNDNDGTLKKVDLTQNPPVITNVFTGGSRGDFVTVGPDGCIYATQSDRILKVVPADGNCNLVSTNPHPSISLSPGSVSPNPRQGSTATLTATLHNVANPGGVPVLFGVSGANPQYHYVTTDASGHASFSYTGRFSGNDTVVAMATVAASGVASDLSAVSWTEGPHTTFTNLGGSPRTGSTGTAITLLANLKDVSVNPPTPVRGVPITIGVGGQTCLGITDGSGTAACNVTLSQPVGSYPLAANFAGTANDLASSDSDSFTVSSPNATVGTALTYTGDTTLFIGATARLAAVLKDSSGNVLSGKSVSFTLGSGASAQTCGGNTDPTGTASCTTAPVAQPVGPATVSVGFAGASGYGASSTTAQVTITTDSTPPTTTGGAAPPPNAAGWNSSLVTVTLTATDGIGGSGVATTYYGIDLPSCRSQATATCSSYAAPFQVTVDGRHTVTYFSKDNAGNVEAAHSLTVNLDQVAPATSLTRASNSTDCAAQVTLVATDATSGVGYIEYQLDGGAWTRYSGPVVVLNNHTLTYRAHDVAGNIEATHSFSVPKSSRPRCPSPFG